MNEWISTKDKLPPDKTWVEAVFRIPNTDITYEMAWFYMAEYWERLDSKRVTHWRFITHPFFNPVIEQSLILELPTNESIRS